MGTELLIGLHHYLTMEILTWPILFQLDKALCAARKIVRVRAQFHFKQKFRSAYAQRTALPVFKLPMGKH